MGDCDNCRVGKRPVLGARHPPQDLPHCLCTQPIGFVEQDNYEAYFGSALDKIYGLPSLLFISAVRLRISKAGLSSTMSSEAMRPVSAIISMHSCASR